MYHCIPNRQICGAQSVAGREGECTGSIQMIGVSGVEELGNKTAVVKAFCIPDDG